MRTKSTKTVGSTVTRTEYLYDGQMPVIERDYNSSGNLSQTRVNVLGARGIEGIIVVPASGSASLKWLMYDGHGNMVRTIDTGFTLSAYQWRGVWGERQTGTLQVGKDYCANLGHQEDETGLVYMRARYYEPGTGRFITEDPARDGGNWYLYADGNPILYNDPDGQEGTVVELGSCMSIMQALSLIAARMGVLLRGLPIPLSKLLQGIDPNSPIGKLLVQLRENPANWSYFGQQVQGPGGALLKAYLRWNGAQIDAYLLLDEVNNVIRHGLPYIGK